MLSSVHSMGLAGIEVDHPDMDEFDKAEAWRIATEIGLYRSGGADHTGLTGNNMKRGDEPNSRNVTPYDADVENGAEKEDFEAIVARRFG